LPEPVLKWLKEAAESNSILTQLEVGSGGTTDASAIHLERKEYPLALISMPKQLLLFHHSGISAE